MNDETREVRLREEVCGRDMQRQRDQITQRKEAIFVTNTNLGGAIIDKNKVVCQGLAAEEAKAIFFWRR